MQWKHQQYHRIETYTLKNRTEIELDNRFIGRSAHFFLVFDNESMLSYIHFQLFLLMYSVIYKVPVN